MILLSIMMCKDLASVGAIKNKLTNYSKCFVKKRGGGPHCQVSVFRCVFESIPLTACCRPLLSPRLVYPELHPWGISDAQRCFQLRSV